MKNLNEIKKILSLLESKVNKAVLKEGTTYDDFRNNYGREIKQSLSDLSKISLICKGLTEEQYEQVFNKVERSLQQYDKNVIQFIFQKAESGNIYSDEIVNLCLENFQRYGTEPQMPLYAIEEASQLFERLSRGFKKGSVIEKYNPFNSKTTLRKIYEGKQLIKEESTDIWEEKVRRHLELERETEKLYAKLEKLNAEKQEIYSDLFVYIKSLKTQQKKFGSILVKIVKERITRIGKNSTKWAKVFAELNDTFELEQRTVKKIVAKWSEKAKVHKHDEENLVISDTKNESKETKKAQLKEGISDWLSAFATFVKTVLGKYINLFGKKVSELERSVAVAESEGDNSF